MPFEYPLVEGKEDKDAIDVFMANVHTYVKRARSKIDDVARALGRPTGMVVPKSRNWFVPFHQSRVTFDILKEHHFRNVLLVARRCRRRPEVIMALWQNEGLPSSYKSEDATPGPFLLLRDWYGKDPKDERQARAWAISAVLWERWGLDMAFPRFPGHIR